MDADEDEEISWNHDVGRRAGGNPSPLFHLHLRPSADRFFVSRRIWRTPAAPLSIVTGSKLDFPVTPSRDTAHGAHQKRTSRHPPRQRPQVQRPHLRRRQEPSPDETPSSTDSAPRPWRLPNEDATVVAARNQSWNEYYNPQSPAAQHLVNQCVQATLLADRCHRYHTAALAVQVRMAADRFFNGRDDLLESHRKRLKTDPADAVRRMGQFGLGCAWMVERWEYLLGRLDGDGYWSSHDCDEAIRLLGQHPETDRLKEDDGAYKTKLFNMIATKDMPDFKIDALLQKRLMSETMQAIYRPDWLPEVADARRCLREMVVERIETYRESESAYSKDYDNANFAESSDRALILQDERQARLFLRYHAESRTSFHRAYGELVKTLARDAAEADEVPGRRRSFPGRTTSVVPSPVGLARLKSPSRPETPPDTPRNRFPRTNRSPL